MEEYIGSGHRKRQYSSLDADASLNVETKALMVEDNGDSVLPIFKPNSVIVASFSGQIMESVGIKNEKELKTTSSKPTTKKPTNNRKYSFILESMTGNVESFAASLRSELDKLFTYFKEISDKKPISREGDNIEGRKMNPLNNSAVACLLEESELPFSKLVEHIFGKIKKKDDGSDQITLAAVRSAILLVGQRSMYGIPEADADILEDESDTCLWCWETRDLRLLPKDHRGVLNVRRRCRKKIHERITAISALMSSLSASINHGNLSANMLKAVEQYAKTSNEEQIRALADDLMRKHDAVLIERSSILKEKATVKELEQNKRMIEKEQKSLERELKRERLLYEKELKKHVDVAEKEEKQHEKEEAEMKKQLKRQQEEAEKDEKRLAKQEAELKRELAVKKQANIMERFLKRKVSDVSDNHPPKRTNYPQSVNVEGMSDEVISEMDQILAQAEALSSDILKSHLSAWRRHRHSSCKNKWKHWGIRCLPKTNVVKELKLQGPSAEAASTGNILGSASHVCSRKFDDDELNIETLVDAYTESASGGSSCSNNVATTSAQRVLVRNKKLLQFDKSHRPAYYGTSSKTSDVVGPRHPFRKDPILDYDNDSDEEWEEEDPGENLSDLEKDEEEEMLEADENSKEGNDDESECSFVVPDGYLSENEGVHVDGMELDSPESELKILNHGETGIQREMSTLLEQQKYLCKLTDHALRKNKPVIVLNLSHEMDGLMTVEGVDDTSKLEQICLQALKIQPIIKGDSIDLTTKFDTSEDNPCTPNQGIKTSAICTPAGSTVLQDSDLREVVSSIQSFSQGINKVMESLQKKFPSVPKTQLRSKVKEVANFVDNKWQVRKEILDQLGLSASPGKSLGRSKGIASFFTKRCLPPGEKTVNGIDTSPQHCKETDPKCQNVSSVLNASR